MWSAQIDYSRLLVDIMPLSKLEAMGILRVKIIEQPIELSGLRDSALFTIV